MWWNCEELCFFGVGFVLGKRLCVEEAELSPLGVSWTWVKGQCTFASDMVCRGRDAWRLGGRTGGLGDPNPNPYL